MTVRGSGTSTPPTTPSEAVGSKSNECQSSSPEEYSAAVSTTSSAAVAPATENLCSIRLGCQASGDEVSSATRPCVANQASQARAAPTTAGRSAAPMGGRAGNAPLRSPRSPSCDDRSRKSASASGTRPEVTRANRRLASSSESGGGAVHGYAARYAPAYWAAPYAASSRRKCRPATTSSPMLRAAGAGGGSCSTSASSGSCCG